MNTFKMQCKTKPFTQGPAACIFGLLVCLSMLLPQSVSLAEETASAGSVVELRKTEQGWELIRNGEPYFIKGGGGQHFPQELADAGGNSMRTWGAENAGEVLDRAHELGLTVTVGIWLQHERHGFNYADADAVASQLETARGYVEKYKDHPALLMWCLGNEVEGDGQNPLVWKAINDAAKMVHEVDPNHPTMTVLAEIGGKIEPLIKHCPEIDVLGINSYGGHPTLGARSAEAGLDRPYVVTEYGPLGQWEVGKTPWGVPYEQTSSEKAKFCEEGYTYSIAGQPGRCLGGYVFNWGAKQEVTSTWYSLFLEGRSTETVDVMTKFWTGEWPDNRAPQIQPIEFLGFDANQVKAGSECKARVTATDPDGDKLVYRWVVQSETTDRQSGGDFEKTPPTHPEAIIAAKGTGVVFKAPTKPGGYRLFVYIEDGQKHHATANKPFFVAQ